ncbi:hypothetical protein N2152v2_011118 [Parachlorella kessleri]
MQGLLLAYDFNRFESVDAFQACLQSDPDATMCHWGVAYSVGPYLNVVDGSAEEEQQQFPPVFGPVQFQVAQRAAQRAQELAQEAVLQDPNSSTAKQELGFANAALLRYAEGSERGHARHAAERAYGEAMQHLGEATQDPTALAMAAEAYLNLCPWDFMDPSTGDKRPDAKAADALLLRALRLNPRHELALHLHVHLAEAGAELWSHPEDNPVPSEGEQSADRLSGLQPRMGHLQHMPSHVYIRVGRYHDAARVNFDAYAADKQAADACSVSYLPEHNLQMLLFAASMAGEYAVVEEWAKKTWSLPETMPRSAWPGREYTMLLLTQVRFGMWDKVLAAKPPAEYERGAGEPGGHAFATGAWHYARCLALASRAQRAQQAQHAAEAQRRQHEAQAELDLVKEAMASLPPDLMTRPGQGVGIYSPGYNDLGRMAVLVAEARLHALERRWQEAASALATAADIEAQMGYVEPPRLLNQPLLQCLGWVRLHLGQYDQAAEAYRKDLAHHPGNAWSLMGLSQALMHSGHSKEAADAQRGFQRAWKHADQQITTSCPAFAA